MKAPQAANARSHHLLSILWSVQFFFLIFYAIHGGLLDTSSIGKLVSALGITYASLLVLAKVVVSLTPNFFFLRSAVPLTIAMVYIILSFYRLRSNTSFDYAIIADNFGSLFHKESLGVVLDRFRPIDLLAISVAYAVLLHRELFKGYLASDMLNLSTNRPQIVVYLALYFGLILAPVSHFDEGSLFCRSIFRYYRDISLAKSELPSEQYPYVKAGSSMHRWEGSIIDRPNIFIVMIESFNAHFVERSAPDGTEYTPFVNSLIPQAVYVERFYGNGTYTIKGQTATLCSMYPTLRGDIASHWTKANMNPLPAVLREEGYHTYFFHALADRTFANTGAFMERIGFESVYSMDTTLTTTNDDEYFWGWGLQDDKFYGKVFEQLDNDHKNRIGDKMGEKYLVTMATIGSHAPFKLPALLCSVFPNPKTVEQRYANAIHFADSSLREFFRLLHARTYLTNSLVLILGDHSVPVGEHDNYSIEGQYFEESFRTPLIISWAKHLEPTRIRNPSYAQIDVAPTILDLLSLNKTNHFVGRSIFSPDRAETTQLLAQTWGGDYIIALKFPYKYVMDLESKRESLFNLQDDPLEKRNLSLSLESEFARELRREARHLVVNQKLVEENRIWPPTH